MQAAEASAEAREATGCVHALVERWAALQPDAVAVSTDEDELTYAQLDARADRLARHLRELGAREEDRVGLLLPRGAEFVVAALAVLKAGGAYIPIDPAYPRERQDLIFSDADARWVVTLPEDAGRFEESGVTPVCLPPALAATTSGPAPADPAVGAGTLAYIIYTSGSTGTPKGVGITHGDIVNLIEADPRLAIRPGDRVAQLAPTAFDASTFEIWCALGRGATVRVVAREQVTVESLGRDLRDVGPQWLFVTTGLFHLLVDYDVDALRHVGTVITGGDVLSPRHVRSAAALDGVRVYAAYGPTETTVFSSLHEASPATPYERVPLGSSLAGKHMHVLDEDLDPVPEGEVGELFIGGEGLARGYHRRPALTAERFLPDPQPGAATGGRLYRTGDLARRLPNGEFEFIGRNDRQVKIRGFRVELGEIEAVLNANDDLLGAAVAAVEDDRGDKRLTAYVALSAQAPTSVTQLRSWVADRVPHYLAPSYYVVLDGLPLDPNGKIDRAALPAPWVSRDTLDVPDYVAPRDDVEELLATLLAESLGVDRVGVHDEFFQLGGDSLRSVSFLEQLRAHGHRVTGRQFFANPTVAELAALVGDSAPASRVAVAAGGASESSA